MVFFQLRLGKHVINVIFFFNGNRAVPSSAAHLLSCPLFSCHQGAQWRGHGLGMVSCGPTFLRRAFVALVYDVLNDTPFFK